MADKPTQLIEIVKMILQFLSDNIWPIVVILFLTICRDALSEFVKRIINLKFKKGKTEVGLEAYQPEIVTEANKAKSIEKEPKEESAEETKIEERKDKDNWFGKMYSAFEKVEIDNAKTIFREYYAGETNEEKRLDNESLFLYLLYSKGKERDAIQKLILLAEKAPTEELMVKILFWVSVCYRDSNNTMAEIVLWKDTIPRLKEGLNITNCIVYYAYALKADKKTKQGMDLLKKRMQKIQTDEERLTLYKAMSDMEKDIGNIEMAALCKEKLVQIKPDDDELLFDAAYAESEASLRSLSVCNYTTLIKLDDKNSTAWNNLGVCASEFKLDTKAYDFYQKSKELGNTLSEANLGYKLIEIGFHEQAMDLANEAVKKKDTHPNIHSLISKIKENVNSEKDKWGKIRDKSVILQRKIRKYVDCYYSGIGDDGKFFAGTWYTTQGIEIFIAVDGKTISSKWTYTIGAFEPANYEANISGVFTNKTASLAYSSNQSSSQSYLGLLGGIDRKNIKCLSYLGDDLSEWHIFSKDIDDAFELILYRKPHEKSIE